MNWFNTIKKYYNAGYYTTDQIKTFVVKGKINATDYQTITELEYTA